MYRIVHLSKFENFKILQRIFEHLSLAFTFALSLCLYLYLQIYICLLYLKHSGINCQPGAPFSYVYLYFLKSRKFFYINKTGILTVKCYYHLIQWSYSDFTNCLLNVFYSRRKTVWFRILHSIYLACLFAFSPSRTFSQSFFSTMTFTFFFNQRRPFILQNVPHFTLVCFP